MKKEYGNMILVVIIVILIILCSIILITNIVGENKGRGIEGSVNEAIKHQIKMEKELRNEQLQIEERVNEVMENELKGQNETKAIY